MTKEQKIADLKKLHPTLTKGVNDEVVTLTAEEYDLTISAWADIILEQEAELERIANAPTEKAALLAKLGITEDEAKLLLS
jgi:hypothetical protein